jgi:APA family basic amino acid/polyamine antiporter
MEPMNEYILFYGVGSLWEYGITGMLIACGPVFGAYVGFDSILTVAQEVRPPTARPIAFATIGSVVISSLIYIGMCTVMIGLIPYKLLNSPNPLSRAM